LGEGNGVLVCTVTIEEIAIVLCGGNYDRANLNLINMSISPEMAYHLLAFLALDKRSHLHSL
jgi:hypothetical protein